MASELRVTTIANNAGTESVDTTYVINGSAKAWVNFNGQGTIAQRDSLNVTSLTDDGVGQHSYSFVNNFNNVDYTHIAGAGTGSFSTTTYISVRTYGGTPTTSTIACNTFYGNTSISATYDAAYVASANHGDLA